MPYAHASRAAISEHAAAALREGVPKLAMDLDAWGASPGAEEATHRSVTSVLEVLQGAAEYSDR